ncbi:helix-turn-helix protein [Lentzea atacamensis]|uniref:Helix-turn-helix protein n=2 Tax=Lentzea TaxID=165301 RepID=A0ABX9DYM8_9PSEU|nr:helix-turn-helix protein [Lentzea atacamensis]
MARKERPLDEGDSPLLRFAADLRTLRRAAGMPTYRRLAALTHYSAATLSDAAGGRKLPTLDVTLAYVRACGGDEPSWERRWTSLAAQPADVRMNRAPQVRAFNAAATMLATVAEAGVVLWHIQDQRLVTVLPLLGPPLRALVFTSDDSHVIGVHTDGVVTTWVI